ncbi:MAG: MarR family transcriptional regulator [Mariprofundaceae bacterium]
MRTISYPPEKIEDGLGFLANQLSSALRLGVSRKCESIGYKATPEALGILFLLSRQDGLTQSQISEFLAKDKAVITRLLNGLVEENLVSRDHDQIDRRIVRSHLTHKGQKALDDIMPAFESFFAEVFAGVDPDEFDVARHVLRQIIANLKQQ